MGKISIQDLSSVLVEKRGLSKKDASNFISEMFDVVQQELEKDKLVKIKGLGTFKIIDVDDRESVNVNTGERVLIEGHGKITFTPDTLMKELVNKPFSQFETVVLNDGVEFEEPKGAAELQDPNDPSSMALVDFGLGNVKADLSSFPVIGDKPIVKASVKREPVVDEIAVKPVAVVPAIDEIAEEPAVEKPAVDKTVIMEPVAEKPAINEPIVEESIAEAPTEEETPEEAKPASDEISGKNVLPNDEEEKSGSKPWLWALVGLVVGLACGYLLGNHFPFGGSPNAPQQEEMVPVQPVVEEPVAVIAAIDSMVAVKDSTEEAAPAAEETAPAAEEETAKTIESAKEETPKEAPKEATKEAPKTKAAKAAAPSLASLSAKYAAKDNRVRLGAYHITGTDKVVTAKEGQTLRQISRAYLGPDMECYVEVYNDMKASTVLKAGQKVKIPKLVWKKTAVPKRKKTK